MSIVPWFVTRSLPKTYSYLSPWLQWPIPEPHGLMKRYRPVLVAERTPPLQLAMVLRRHPLPSDTDIRPLLAWFYDAMLYVTQKPVDISLPLPLINTNEVYVMGAHGIRRFAFLVPFLSMYKSGSWEIKKPFHHQVEAVNMDKWTRYDSCLPCNLTMTIELLSTRLLELLSYLVRETQVPRFWTSSVDLACQIVSRLSAHSYPKYVN